MRGQVRLEFKLRSYFVWSKEFLEAKMRTGYSAADFSPIRQVKLEHFTVDRLMQILDKLNRHVRVLASIGPRAMGAPTHHHTV